MNRKLSTVMTRKWLPLKRSTEVNERSAQKWPKNGRRNERNFRREMVKKMDPFCMLHVSIENQHKNERKSSHKPSRKSPHKSSRKWTKMDSPTRKWQENVWNGKEMTEKRQENGRKLAEKWQETDREMTGNWQKMTGKWQDNGRTMAGNGLTAYRLAEQWKVWHDEQKYAQPQRLNPDRHIWAPFSSMK